MIDMSVYIASSPACGELNNCREWALDKYYTKFQIEKPGILDTG